jgi:hypothetical protein
MSSSIRVERRCGSFDRISQGKSRKVFFAVGGLPRDRRNFDGTPSDEAVVHALPVVVIVDDNPGCARCFSGCSSSPDVCVTRRLQREM